MKAEARSPRAERRPSSEIRRPKSAAEGDSGFGLRVSAFFRPSDLTRVVAPERGAAASPSPPQEGRGLGRGGPSCFLRLLSRDHFHRRPPPAHLAGILRATVSSPWPSPPKEERETALRPANSELPVIAAKRHKTRKNIMLLCTAIVEIARCRDETSRLPVCLLPHSCQFCEAAPVAY